MNLNKLLREPLLHFSVLGACLFALFAWTADDAMQAPDDILVDTVRIESLKAHFQRMWKREPTQEELPKLIKDWVREEVLYREGLALGLDKNDPLLRQRIVQKMEFISEDLIEPSINQAELAQWFAKNANNYRIEAHYSLRQLYLKSSGATATFEASVNDIKQALARGEMPTGDETHLPATLNNASLVEVRRTFGEAFSKSLSKIAVGAWVGPIVSGFGSHFVYIDSMQASRVPELNEVRKVVERDYLAELTRQSKERLFDQLHQPYTIIYDESLALTPAESGYDKEEKQ